jgi:hypothetical protein
MVIILKKYIYIFMFFNKNIFKVNITETSQFGQDAQGDNIYFDEQEDEEFDENDEENANGNLNRRSGNLNRGTETADGSDSDSDDDDDEDEEEEEDPIDRVSIFFLFKNKKI